MRHRTVQALLQALAFTIAMLAGVAATAAEPGRRGHLVTVAWLEKNLGREGVRLIDASGSRHHAAKHIAGAVGVDLYRYGYPHNVPAPVMEARIQSWGVSPGDTVVIYDEGASMMATWVFYELYSYGFPVEDVVILDGGLAKWEAEGKPVTKEATPPPAKGSFRVQRVVEDGRTRLPEFLVASGDRAGHAIVDAMGPEYYFGAAKLFHGAGHVPNAILLPVPELFNADRTFKSADELRRMARHLGIRPEHQVHSHCGGGIAATVPFFALRFIAGYPHVKVYRESQLEWLRDERGLPFWTYAAPTMKREAAWLDGWNNRMTRMFGVANVSIVDVRPPPAYASGHVPYALGIPAETFRQHLNEPEKLAALLGPAGVNPLDEAVIVSTGGVNPAAAMAFVALEALGQKKVSLLMESVDEWGFRGLTLAKEPTVVGKPASPQQAAVPPAKYAPPPRSGVILRSADAPPSGYPRVFLASGAAPPSKAPEGKTLHVPYASLLNADGTPRGAHEIWKVLEQAGVSRYAEIVCIADDPAEAAVNYYVLKLMGFPDVKVLMPG